MDSDTHLPMLLAVLVVLLVFSAYFSASETAFSSINRIKLKNSAADGDKRAIRTLKLAERFDELLSSVLIGNNIVNIAGSAIATVICTSYLGDAAGPTFATIFMTILVLFFGEVTPKTLAKENPEKFAMFSTPFLWFLVRLCSPFNLLFAKWKAFVLRLFKVDTDRSISEDELLTFVGEVREEGGINEDEESMIRQAIEFDDLKAADILTPRVDVTAIDVDAEPAEISTVFYETGFSRLPVYRHSIDSVLGVIILKDYFFSLQKGWKGVEPLIRPAVFVSRNIKISSLFSKLQQTKSHMAVIVDEFGGTIGIVTLEDIMEELVGEIWDEHDEVIEDIKQLSEGKYLVLGGTDIEDMLGLFDMEPDDELNSSTVGGWVSEILGRFTEQGEVFEHEGLRIKVGAIERHRILDVMVEGRHSGRA